MRIVSKYTFLYGFLVFEHAFFSKIRWILTIFAKNGLPKTTKMGQPIPSEFQTSEKKKQSQFNRFTAENTRLIENKDIRDCLIEKNKPNLDSRRRLQTQWQMQKQSQFVLYHDGERMACRVKW